MTCVAVVALDRAPSRSLHNNPFGTQGLQWLARMLAINSTMIELRCDRGPVGLWLPPRSPSPSLEFVHSTADGMHELGSALAVNSTLQRLECAGERQRAVPEALRAASAAYHGGRSTHLLAFRRLPRA